MIEGRGYWSYQEIGQQHPGIEITRIPVDTVVDYVRSMEVVHQAVKKDSPEIVFVPDRGAQPLFWTLEAFHERDVLRGNGDELRFCRLPIGTVTSSISGSQHGYNSTHKKEIIAQALDRLSIEDYTLTQLSHVVLLDEAQSGSTSSTAVRLLRDILGPQVKITYIPCKDEGRGVQIRNAHTNYKSMASGEWKNIEGHSIPVPLFYIDRPIFLDFILDPESDNEERNPLMLMTLHNTEARETFINLTRIGLHKDIARKLLNHNYNLPDNIKPLYDDIFVWINTSLNSFSDSNMTQPGNIKNQRRQEEFVSWFKRYAQAFVA